MAEIGVYYFKVEPRDLDYRNRPSLAAIGDYVLNAAGEDADKNGFGVSNLNENNCSWVLSRMALELNYYPAQHEDLSVTTWVSEIGRVMTTRNLVMKNGAGEVVASAVTNWAMINLDTRRPVDLSSNNLYSDMVINIPSPIDRPAKIGPVEPGITTDHKVVYSDIDFNGHANSMKYMTWMVNLLPKKYHEEKTFHRFDINFIQEALYGETVQVCLEEKEDCTLFEILNEKGATACKGMLNWE